MALSEIEKLERRYAENPQGLTFAPLAEVHRKNGEVSRALDLLRPGLTLHPDYIPASIVLGRCHLDLGDLPAAEAAFAHVLGLDGENVIALKALADITERLYRFDESERWLRTLLAVDRSNDEARDQLGRVEVARRQAETASSASPDAGIEVADARAGTADGSLPADSPVPGAGAAETAAPEMVSLADVPPGVSPPPMPDLLPDGMLGWVAESGSPVADQAVPLDLEELVRPDEPAGPPPEGIELEEQVTLEAPVAPLAGLVGRDQGPHNALGEEPGGGFAFETAEDIVLESGGGGEFQVANAAEELLASRELREPEPLRPTRPPDIEADASEMMPFGSASERLEAPEPAVVEPELAWSAPLVTAEAVAAAPGAVAAEPTAAAPEFAGDDEMQPPPPEPVAGAGEAAASEPAVVEQAPAPVVPVSPPAWSRPSAEPPRPPELDLVLTESMAALLMQQGHRGEALTIYRHLERRVEGGGRFRDRIAELELATSMPTQAYTVKETHGQSVQDLLRGVLASRPPAAPPSPATHAGQARPAAADPGAAPTRPAHDSLSLSSVFGEESTPTPPAVPAAGASGTGAGAGGVSYDDFFGAPGASATPRPPRAPDPKSDDLDQFHAWLQNLKR